MNEVELMDIAALFIKTIDSAYVQPFQPAAFRVTGQAVMKTGLSDQAVTCV